MTGTQIVVGIRKSESGMLCVNECLNEKGYAVTHLGTGVAIGKGMPKRVAVRLMELIDGENWNRPRRELEGDFELAAKVRDAYNRAMFEYSQAMGRAVGIGQEIGKEKEIENDV